jgi:hypothetical protein
MSNDPLENPVQQMLDQFVELRGFLEMKFDRVETRLDLVETRLDRVETRLTSVDGRLSGIEREFAQRRRKKRG